MTSGVRQFSLRLRGTRRSLLTLAALCGIWLLLVLLADPRGEFPLNDDWSYARAVMQLVDHGHLELTGFTSMPLLAQVFWGALFCLPFGFSFLALRISTITLGLVGIVAAYQLLEQFTDDHMLAVLGTLLLAVNPLYFQLSLTFMTDVPFFAFSMLSILFLARALQTEQRWPLVVGFLLALVALLIRQLAIIIPIAFLIAYVIKHGPNRRALLGAAIPAAALVGLLLAFPALLGHTIGLPALYNRAYEPIQEAALQGAFRIVPIFLDRLFVEWIYLGLFTLPFGILVAGQPAHRYLALLQAATFLAIAGLLLWQHRSMPLTGNVLFDGGLGPVLLRDTYILGLSHWPSLPPVIWTLVTLAAIVGSVLLLSRLAAIAQRAILQHSLPLEQRPVWVFLLSAAALYAFAIAVTGFLDRYLIWLLPLLACILVASRSRSPLHVPPARVWIAGILVTASALFGVAGTHDYLAWNRARWQALGDLMTLEHASFADIDGGFEFNGWYAYNANYIPVPSKSWWWIQDDDIVISLGPIPGYVERKRVEFQRWMPFGRAGILVLSRGNQAIP